MKIEAILLSTIVMLGVPSVGQSEVGGTVTVRTDAGEYVFPLTEEKSDWLGREMPNGFHGDISIYSWPTDEKLQGLFKEFSLGLSLSGPNVSNAEAQLTRLVNGDPVRYFANDDTQNGLSITIENIDISGEEMNVVGSFSSSMGKSENYGVDIDLSDSIDVNGEFNVVIPAYSSE